MCRYFEEPDGFGRRPAVFSCLKPDDFDKREFFQTPSVASPMRCGIPESVIAV